MADADLDDFFAKKDKSKKKSKSKAIISADILEKQATDEPKKKTKKKKEKEKKSGTQQHSNVGPKAEDDDQWNEIIETETDYSGLRIQNLQITGKDDEEEHQENDDQGSDEEGCEGRRKKDAGAQGPWMVQQAESVQPSQAPAPTEPAAPTPEPAKEEPESAASAAGGGGGGGRYVPPALRRGGAAADSPASPSTTSQQYQSRKKKVAPNIRSDLDFPTLGGGPGGGGIEYEAAGEWGGARFEAVRGGSKGEDSTQQSVKLQLGNKFDALSGVDS